MGSSLLSLLNLATAVWSVQPINKVKNSVFNDESVTSKVHLTLKHCLKLQIAHRWNTVANSSLAHHILYPSTLQCLCGDGSPFLATIKKKDY